MIWFSISKISEHKKHKSLLLIHQEQIILNLAFEKQK
jgi:hypothetical protein